jgi:hypothetical protein
MGIQLKTMLAALCATVITLAASHAPGESPPTGTRCDTCGRILGAEVPDTAISKDLDFKRLDMFQTCQHCLDKKMDRMAQAKYFNVVRKYKWNSIEHNKSMASRPFNRCSLMAH